MSGPVAKPGCALLALVVALGCGSKSGDPSDPLVAPATRPVAVETLRVEPRSLDDTVRATGAIEPFRNSVLSAEVAGPVQSIDVEIGQAVEAGDVVAVIDEEAYRIAVQRATALRDAAKANVEQAEQDLAREQERFDQKVVFEEKLRVARFRRLIAEADRNLARTTWREAKRELERQLALYRKGVAAESRVDEAREAEEAAKARLDAAQSRLDQAEEDLKRQETVFASGLLSRQELDTAAVLLEAAKAKLASAQADLDAALKDLRDCRIAAPFAGKIAEKHVEMGQRVAPGAPVATLVDVAKVKVAVGLPDVDRVRVRLGNPATVRVDAYPDRSREGAVTALAPMASEDTGVFVVEVTIDNAGTDPPLLPGMIARIELITGRFDGALLVPREAVLGDGATRYLYIVEQAAGGEGDAAVARRRAVVVARTVGREALVAEGLRPGDQVVVGGHRRLRDGAPVRVQSAPEAAEGRAPGLASRAPPAATATTTEGTP